MTKATKMSFLVEFSIPRDRSTVICHEGLLEEYLKAAIHGYIGGMDPDTAIYDLDFHKITKVTFLGEKS